MTFTGNRSVPELILFHFPTDMAEGPSAAKKPKNRDSSNLRDDRKCLSCGYSIRKATLKNVKVVRNEEDRIFYAEHTQKEVEIGDVVCARCRTKITFKKAKTGVHEESSGKNDDLGENRPEPAAVHPGFEDGTLPNSSHGVCPNFLAIQETVPERSSLPRSSKKSNYREQEAFSQFSQLSLTPTPSSSQSSAAESVYPSPPTKSVIEVVEMPFKRVFATHRRCCVCSNYVRDQPMVTIPIEARIQAFTTLQVFIPRNNRCCKDHILKKRFLISDLSTSGNYFSICSNTSDIEITELALFLEKMS